MCAVACGYYLDCRAGTGAQGLITDPDLVAAVNMHAEALNLERQARRLKDEAKAALTGVEGSTGNYTVKWTKVSGGHVEYERAGYEKLDSHPYPLTAGLPKLPKVTNHKISYVGLDDRMQARCTCTGRSPIGDRGDCLEWAYTHQAKSTRSGPNWPAPPASKPNRTGSPSKPTTPTTRPPTGPCGTSSPTNSKRSWPAPPAPPSTRTDCSDLRRPKATST